LRRRTEPGRSAGWAADGWPVGWVVSDLLDLRGRDPKTIEAYGRGLNEYLSWLNDRSPTAVDELDAYAFIRHMQTRGNLRQLSTGGTLKNATLQQKVTVVRLFYDDLLRRLGCERAQGYFFSRPVPLEQLSL